MPSDELAYIGETIPIPHADMLEPKHENIGSGGYTAGVAYRYDAVGRNKSYTIGARNLSYSEYEDIDDHLQDTLGSTTFWLDEFGGESSTDSVDAQISITRDERVQFFRNGSFEPKGRTIELEVILST